MKKFRVEDTSNKVAIIWVVAIVALLFGCGDGEREGCKELADSIAILELDEDDPLFKNDAYFQTQLDGIREQYEILCG